MNVEAALAQLPPEVRRAFREAVRRHPRLGGLTYRGWGLAWSSQGARVFRYGAGGDPPRWMDRVTAWRLADPEGAARVLEAHAPRARARVQAEARRLLGTTLPEPVLARVAWSRRLAPWGVPGAIGYEAPRRAPCLVVLPLGWAELFPSAALAQALLERDAARLAEAIWRQDQHRGFHPVGPGALDWEDYLALRRVARDAAGIAEVLEAARARLWMRGIARL